MSLKLAPAHLCCLAALAMSVQMGGCKTNQSNPSSLWQSPGYNCTAQIAPISVHADLDMDGNVLGVTFNTNQEINYDGFTVNGMFNEQFLHDEAYGGGTISLWVPTQERALMHEPVITEILRQSEDQLVIVETLPPFRMAGYVFISKSWPELREINSGVDFLTFKIKSVVGETLYERDFDTQQFWKLDHMLKQAAGQMREKITSYKTQCKYVENRIMDEIIAN